MNAPTQSTFLRTIQAVDGRTIEVPKGAEFDPWLRYERVMERSSALAENSASLSGSFNRVAAVLAGALLVFGAYTHNAKLAVAAAGLGAVHLTVAAQSRRKARIFEASKLKHNHYIAAFDAACEINPQAPPSEVVLPMSKNISVGHVAASSLVERKGKYKALALDFAALAAFTASASPVGAVVLALGAGAAALRGYQHHKNSQQPPGTLGQQECRNFVQKGGHALLRYHFPPGFKLGADFKSDPHTPPPGFL